MPEIIDVLTLPTAQLPTIAVNNAVDYVSPVYPAGTNILQNAGSEATFEKGDSFKLLSIGFIFPEAMTVWKILLGNPMPTFFLKAMGATTGDFFNNPSFTSGYSFVPSENFDLVVNSFYGCSESYSFLHPTKNLLTENFYLTSQISSCFISMQGVPAGMNGKIFFITPFVKVLHTIPLS